MSYTTIQITTQGEAFYSLTDQVKDALPNLLTSSSGILHLFVMHTSCALTISEEYDPTARKDMESFMKHIAPRDLPFI